MYPDPFNPPLLSSQVKNPTWGRPARKSRPQRSPSPSCSSRPSGRWRTSSMSLLWSSSSLSGHMLSEKRTGNSTCWHKTSSMRKSTPKTEETHVHRRRHRLRCAVWDEKQKEGETKRLPVTVWLVCTCDWEHNVELQNNPSLTQQNRLAQTWITELSPANWTRSSRFRQQVVLPSSPLGLHSLSLPFQRLSVQRASAGTCLETASPTAGQTSTPDWLHCFPIQTKHFHWLCTVWLCLVVF